MLLKNKTSLIATLLFALVTGCNAFQASSPPTGHLPDSISAHAGVDRQLVWSDEFDYTGIPDPSKWDYEEGYVRNNELQYYTKSRPENARVENGMLIIETRKEPSSGHKYTSASLTTKDRADWLYGRIEVRAKLPAGRGMWTSIFTLGDNIDDIGWPACGEIDIMENVGFYPDRVYATVHTEAYNHILKTHKSSSLPVPQPSKEFHVYAIEWFHDKIDFFVDETRYFTFENEGTGRGVWPFDKKHFLIINAAVGGSLGGRQGVDDSIFPQKFYVDYVRVYQGN
ncbi:MAG: glycoside hydrolase family 16 protein [Nitrospiraceae bacterium]|nr:MAG: glycoside hydrolase family 16 protein [Nitrospiraceae bacterium]